MTITLPLQPTADDLAHLESDHSRKHTPHLLDPANAIRQRIVIERAVIRRAITDMLAAGWEVRVYYGEGDYGTDWTRELGAVMGAVCACDEEWIRARRATDHGQERAGIYLVYGNDGWDVISDYSLLLEPELEGANAFADQIADAAALGLQHQD